MDRAQISERPRESAVVVNSRRKGLASCFARSCQGPAANPSESKQRRKNIGQSDQHNCYVAPSSN